MLAWTCTEAVRTQSRELVLGRSLSEFMRSLGIYSTSGGEHTRLRNQMDRLFNAHVQLVYEDEHGKRFVSSQIADQGEFWWSERKPDERSLWESKIELGEKFFNEIIASPVPLDMNILKALKRSPLGLGPVHVAHLSHVQPDKPAAGRLVEPLPAVRRGPGPSRTTKTP